MSYGGSSGGGSIAGATDTALSNPLNGNVLAYDSSVQKWRNQAQAGGQLVIDALIISGSAAVGSNVLPPGYRVPRSAVLTSAYLFCGTAPNGSPLTATVSRSGTVLFTFSIASGQTSASLTGQSVSVVAGDILQFNITAIGSTGPGSDVAIQLIGV